MPVKAKYENLNLSTSPALSVPNVVYFVFKLLFKKKLFNLTKKKANKKNIPFFLPRNPLMYSLIHKNIAYIFTGLFLVFKALIAILFFSW